MKTKIKKWHIMLMSFMALFVAVFASLFSLKADTVDDETGEVIKDNWELGVVFYDSTVDGGTTPLTEIDWDASNGGYVWGDARTITVQINYKNTSAVTTYNPGDCIINVTNLMYNLRQQNADGSYTYFGSANAEWSTSVNIGANDDKHTGYDWDFKNYVDQDQYTRYYFYSDEFFTFTNAKTIEEGSNFEGSIQIQYTIRPQPDNYVSYANAYNPEFYDDFCVHEAHFDVQANLYLPFATSPGWPTQYPGDMTQQEYFWEYTLEGAENINIMFNKNSYLSEYSGDYIYVYDKQGILVKKIQNTTLNTNRNNDYDGVSRLTIEGDYVKIAMETNTYSHDVGFAAYVLNDCVSSNIITFDYTRTYTHEWSKNTYTVEKIAEKISFFDGAYDLVENPNDYYWVKYYFTVDNYDYHDRTYFPKIYHYYYCFEDVVPEGCIVAQENGTRITPVDGKVRIQTTSLLQRPYPHSYYFYPLIIAYPKSIYNEENNNLIIENTVSLYASYQDDKENLIYQNDDTVRLNLGDFNFEYSGNLYGLYKSFSGNATYEGLTDIDPDLSAYGNATLELQAIYQGAPMDVRWGDDLLFITKEDGSYRKLENNEYYFSSIKFPSFFYNGFNESGIPSKTYTCELWIKSGDSDYVLHEEFLNQSKSWSFSKTQNVTGYYFIIKNLNKSIRTSPPSSGGTYHQQATIQFTDIAQDISQNGTIYNLAYLQVFANGILLNEQTLDNYANLLTKDLVATYDLENYGAYIQRSASSFAYKNYVFDYSSYGIGSSKEMSSATQDAEKEIFKGYANLYLNQSTSSSSWTVDQIKNYFPKERYLKGFEIYDILPKGMTLANTEEELYKKISISAGTTIDQEGNTLTSAELKELIFNGLTINVQENWNNTGRTCIYIKIDFSSRPLIIYKSSFFRLQYNWEIPYDSYTEFGSVWKNNMYWNYYGNDLLSTSSSIYYTNFDNDIIDIDLDGVDDWTCQSNYYKSNKYALSSAQITVSSVISTHQDVTTYVKTTHNNYTTNTANSDYYSEYEYKLRVRTGTANVTNLIIYTNIEEAQPNRTRWKGEFLGIDTSYAKSKGYNAKPYYSENPAAGNLYNEDGSLNSDWKEYFEPQEELKANGLAITFNNQSKTENNCDYVIIYYEKDGKIYQTQKLMGTNFAGKTVTIPSTDFYLYWYTDSSACSYYGFSIDSIVPAYIEKIEDTTGTIPSYTTTEIQDDIYPDSAFGSYTHGNYGNSIRKLWHYTYTDELPIVQEYREGTDKTKVKSLAFEYLDNNKNPAVIPFNSMTYVLIQMKSPIDENIKTLARMDCRTQWNALDNFDRPVDFITGINSNVVKVALPNSVDEDSVSSVTLRFTKEIDGTASEFENMLLNKNNSQTFKIRLTSLIANEDGTYNQITALLRSDQELIISQIPVGTYLLEELGDNYFDFVGFTDNNDPEIIVEGVTFERTDQGYIITVSEDLTENIEFNIKVTNKIEDERFYEYKDNKENLFLKNKIENEDA